jgi:4'-phosphopantetheinyl transferase
MAFIQPAPEAGWRPAPDRPVLAAGEVHLWRATLDQPADRRAALARALTPDEVARADRFVQARDRARFVVARGVLRAILGRYLGMAPAALRFHYPCACGRPDCDPVHRKPALVAASGGRHPLRFNLSHAQGLALYAVALEREVGVDLEAVSDEAATLAVAATIFGPAELAAWRALPPARQPAAFYAGWTRKEAYLKARGLGLALAPDQVEVSLAPDEPAALRRVAGDPAAAGRWSLVSLDAGPAYAAALAVEGPLGPLRCWDWTG